MGADLAVTRYLLLLSGRKYLALIKTIIENVHLIWALVTSKNFQEGSSHFFGKFQSEAMG